MGTVTHRPGAWRRAALRIGVAALGTASLTGCYAGDLYGASDYGYGYGYGQQGYGYGYDQPGYGYGYQAGYDGYGYDCDTRYGQRYWDADPYGYDDGYYGYDCYDANDYRGGFLDIGFGGGWYNDYYYPGYGLSIFDRFGRGYLMDPYYLNYWGGRRAYWQHHRDRTPRSARRPDQYRGAPVRPGLEGRDARQSRDGQRFDGARQPLRPGALRPTGEQLDRVPRPGTVERVRVIRPTQGERPAGVGVRPVEGRPGAVVTRPVRPAIEDRDQRGGGFIERRLPTERGARPVPRQDGPGVLRPVRPVPGAAVQPPERARIDAPVRPARVERVEPTRPVREAREARPAREAPAPRATRDDGDDDRPRTRTRDPQ